MTQNRHHDLVLFGASGFVGRLVAQHLADQAPAGLRIALAGRTLSRLEEVRDLTAGPSGISSPPTVATRPPWPAWPGPHAWC